MRIRYLALLPMLLAISPGLATEGVAVSPPQRHTLAPEIAVASNGDIAVIWLDRDSSGPAPAVAATPAAAPGAASASHDAGQTPGQAPGAHGPGAPPERHTSSMDLWFARSQDGGTTFSAPVRINPEPGMVWGFAVSKPKLAIARSGTVHVVFPANMVRASDGKTTLVMYYTRSTDGGRSFEAPRLLHSKLDLDQSQFMDGGFTSAHAFGALGVAPDDSVHAVWVDTREMKSGHTDAAAYAAASRDDGRTFTTEQVALADGVCPCCQLTMAFDAGSNMYLGSRVVTEDGHRNSSVVRVAAGDTSKAGKRIPIGGAAWKLDGCPLKPTTVAVDGRNVYAAAYNGGEAKAGAYFSASNDGGAHFRPAVPLHAEATVSDAPAMVVAGGMPVIAWHGKTTGGKRVFWRTAARGGRTLGPVQELDAPPGVAQSAALATRPDGKVQVVWQQGEQIYTTALQPQAPVPGARRP